MVKVIHAFKKLEEINRDLVELGKLQERIAEDRDYSDYLKDSFQMEIKKLSGYREDLLEIEVKTQASTVQQKIVSNTKEEGKKLYDDNESSYRAEVAQEPAVLEPKKETKKKPERPVYKY
ncbi:hypothetical protein [Leptospira sp. GIMC2001]|uniref:hypothetical protein n=1 Tax=Leptospira sp. GIMC2001 TaxID=1513297 RepID=UPI00234B408D|nr:hypothetical protein [Leptospira sp. GIMC2001]WCL48023.1 hypothetical protein O4O04_11915 [Leptospira sp. GIMC2001]